MLGLAALGLFRELRTRTGQEPVTQLTHNLRPRVAIEHNAHRMCYSHFRKLGMFVGSGAVEAGCKAVVAQRCKLSGMSWTVSGATGILTLRCLEASDRG